MTLLKELYERLEKEIWEIVHREEWTPTCVEVLAHLTKAMKHTKELMCEEETAK